MCSLVTNLDRVCAHVSADTAALFNSQAAQECLDKVHTLFNVRANIKTLSSLSIMY